MTRYRVPVSDEMLAGRDAWQPAEGFRLVSADEPFPGHPGVTLCTIEDDGAPAAMEGRLVIPVLARGPGGSVKIIGRSVAGGP